jgi:hypothetical protein
MSSRKRRISSSDEEDCTDTTVQSHIRPVDVESSSTQRHQQLDHVFISLEENRGQRAAIHLPMENGNALWQDVESYQTLVAREKDSLQVPGNVKEVIQQFQNANVILDPFGGLPGSHDIAIALVVPVKIIQMACSKSKSFLFQVKREECIETMTKQTYDATIRHGMESVKAIFQSLTARNQMAELGRLKLKYSNLLAALKIKAVHHTISGREYVDVPIITTRFWFGRTDLVEHEVRVVSSCTTVIMPIKVEPHTHTEVPLRITAEDTLKDMTGSVLLVITKAHRGKELVFIAPDHTDKDLGRTYYEVYPNMLKYISQYIEHLTDSTHPTAEQSERAMRRVSMAMPFIRKLGISVDEYTPVNFSDITLSPMAIVLTSPVLHRIRSLCPSLLTSSLQIQMEIYKEDCGETLERAKLVFFREGGGNEVGFQGSACFNMTARKRSTMENSGPALLQSVEASADVGDGTWQCYISGEYGQFEKHFGSKRDMDAIIYLPDQDQTPSMEDWPLYAQCTLHSTMLEMIRERSSRGYLTLFPLVNEDATEPEQRFKQIYTGEKEMRTCFRMLTLSTTFEP